MTIEIQSSETKNGIIILKIKGEIDMNSSPEVRNKLVPYFEENRTAVIVVLSDVPYIDSSGIATFVEGLQWSHNTKNKFRLVGLSTEIKEIFKIAHLESIFEIFETTEGALQGI